MKASVIVATYKNARFLSLCLSGFLRQSERNFEILIADDGSGPEIAAVVAEYSDLFKHPIQHVWHEDKGWRKNMVLNECVRRSKSPYLIFIDQDCVPHRDFVKEHLLSSRPGVFLAGRRVALLAKATERLTPAAVRAGHLERTYSALLWLALSHGVRHWEDAVWTPRILRPLFHRRHTTLIGCNFSLHKSDLVRVNGFDEGYDGPAIGEDVDIEYRLFLAGMKAVSVRNQAIQYHLHHQDLFRTPGNADRFLDVQRRRAAVCENGLVHKAASQGVEQ